MTSTARTSLEAPVDATGTPAVEVVYVGGWGRSGSTLLSYILAELPGFMVVGELRYLWGALADGELCGCGTPISSCPFWTAVGERAFGGWCESDVEEMIRLERELFARPRAALLLAPSLWPPYAEQLRRYVERLDRLYTAIHDVGERRLIVDSTKDPPYGFALRRAARVRLSLIHLVRDSRAAAFAWSKEVRRPEITDRQAYFPRYNTVNSAVLWSGGNLALELLSRFNSRHQLIRYEALATVPRREVERLLDRLTGGTARYDLSSLQRGEFRLTEHHTIRGNPIRFERGHRAIRLDDEWKRSMPARRRALITLLTWPLLLRYGYLTPSRRR